MSEIHTIADLHFDPKNARRRTERSYRMLQESLEAVGAARSIVIDETNMILAGNGTVEAAGRAGIERVKVVDADGDTIVAVRRRGLSADQKTALALYDNRTADEAEWDAEVLAALQLEGVDLSPFWRGDEVQAMMDAAAGMPGADAWGAAVGSLPDGDKTPFQQMTFTLHDAQATVVHEALAHAKAEGDFAGSPNENGNGNALTLICEAYLNA